MEKNEKRFYKVLEDIFIGASIQGDSGYVNLLKIKENYYTSVINKLKKDIDENIIIKGAFKEELFEKMYNFFEKYFSESGSVYFTKTANWQNVYEKIYTDNNDVILFWKTHMLYYVKTDYLFNNALISVKDENNVEYNIFFNVEKLKQKQNNEKKELIYEYITKKDLIYNDTKVNSYIFEVKYSEKGKKNKIDDLSKKSSIDEEILLKAINTFQKQSEVDFFINKNAQEFLQGQLEIYINQILLKQENTFDEKRLLELKTIKTTISKIINFISQFENELVRIWNKPKFVLNSNYILSLTTLKKYLTEENYIKLYKNTIAKYKENKDYQDDIKNVIKNIYKQPLAKVYVSDIDFDGEFYNLKYVKVFKDKTKLDKYLSKNPKELEFKLEIFDKNKEIEGPKATYSNINLIQKVTFDKSFIDTKYMTKKEKYELIDMLTSDNNLDDIINGYLIKSDNYQFLNTVNKFNNKVDCIYIDPPFNTEGAGFAYCDKYKDSTWLTMMNDRFSIAKNKFLSSKGSFYIHLDSNCNYLARMLLNNIFKKDPKREIVWNTGEALSGLKVKAPNWIRQHDTIFFYCNDGAEFNKMWVKNKKYDTPSIEVEEDEVVETTERNITDIGWLDVFKRENGDLYTYKYIDDSGIMKEVNLPKFETKAIGDIWNDIYSMMYSQNMTRENWGEDNTQKPENLTRRILQSSSNQNSIVMDFFAGSGTTLATAHKLNRKWIGVEMGDFIDSIVLNRMKAVVFGDYRAKLSEDINWNGGGIFKYYELEQYENTLRKCIYSDTQIRIDEKNSDFSDYIFFADKKLTDFIKENNNKINLDFEDLYNNIDLPETISNILGLPIIKYNQEEVVLDCGNNETKVAPINPKKMNEEEKMELLMILKPLLWWGE